MNLLPIDIIQIIFGHLDSLDQIRFRHASPYNLSNLQITSLCLPPYYRSILFGPIGPKLKLFPSLTDLDLSDMNMKPSPFGSDRTYLNSWLDHLDLKILHMNNNCSILNLNQITTLRELYIHNTRGIDTNSIAKLNLEFLDADYNQNITNVSHMTNLHELHTDGGVINDNGIHNLDLCILSANDNQNISTVYFMKNLQELYAEGTCGIDDNSIRGLKLRILSARYNPKITNVSHMTTLQELRAEDSCGINDIGIKGLDLKVLYADDNNKITNINHLTNLQILYTYGDSGIGDEGIRHINLIELWARDNKKITDVKHMSRLSVLDAEGKCGINDAGISGLKLDELYTNDNTQLKTRIIDVTIPKIGMLKKLLKILEKIYEKCYIVVTNADLYTNQEIQLYFRNSYDEDEDVHMSFSIRVEKYICFMDILILRTNTSDLYKSLEIINDDDPVIMYVSNESVLNISGLTDDEEINLKIKADITYGLVNPPKKFEQIFYHKIVMKTTTIKSICEKINRISDDDHIIISVDNNKIGFKNESCKNINIELTHNLSNFDRTKIFGTYDLKRLLCLTGCADISDTVELYFRHNADLVLKINAGYLGDIYFYVPYYR